MTADHPTIDPVFQALCPPLLPEEVALLETDLLEYGCRDALAVWDAAYDSEEQVGGRLLVLDGHNRLRICQEHGIPYETVEIELDDRPAARIWIRNNQLGRRNLTPAWRIELQLGNKADWAEIGQERQAHGQTAPGKTLLSFGDKSVEPHNTRAEIARAAGVSTGLVAEAEVIRRDAPELWERAKAGEETIGGAYRKVRQKSKRRDLEQKRQDIAAQLRQSPEAPLVELADFRDWLPRQPSCDLVLTDPPYSTDVDDIGAFAAEWLPMALGRLLPTGRAYIFIGAYPAELLAYLSVALPEQVLVWTYRNTLGPKPALNYVRNLQFILYYRMPQAPPLDCPLLMEQIAVQDFNHPARSADRLHQWQKPDQLAEQFVRHATKPGDLVLDPFCCTGTFPLAAARLGRVGRGCDNDSASTEIAWSRGCRRG